jgi:hypothetical protein
MVDNEEGQPLSVCRQALGYCCIRTLNVESRTLLFDPRGSLHSRKYPNIRNSRYTTSSCVTEAFLLEIRLQFMIVHFQMSSDSRCHSADYWYAALFYSHNMIMIKLTDDSI